MVLVEDQKRTTPRYWSGLIDLSVIPLSGEATEINQVHLNVMGVFDCGVGAFSVSTNLSCQNDAGGIIAISTGLSETTPGELIRQNLAP